MQTFLGVERRFARLAKVYVITAGLTGVMLFLRRGGFEGFGGGLGIMFGFKIFVWLLFFILLFGAEKHLMKIIASQQTTPEKVFKRMILFHWFMLTLSGTAIAFGLML